MKKLTAILFLAIFSLQSFSVDVLQYILSSNLCVEEIHGHDGAKDGLQKGFKKDSIAGSMHTDFNMDLTALKAAGAYILTSESFTSNKYFEITVPPPNFTA